MKRFDLVKIIQGRCRNHKVIVLYDIFHGCNKEVEFFDYNKKEIIRKLRNEYDCTVSREFC